MGHADIPVRVHELTPAEAAEWSRFDAQERPGLDLINCRECRIRSGTWCGALNHPHVPLELNHRCAHYKPSRRREA